MNAVQIVGGGPAGTAAAIAALSEAAVVRIAERSAAPRHKVCGEFIPAEAAPLLEKLGVWEQFIQRSPARINRCALYDGRRLKHWSLSEQGYGLSRFELDRLLLEKAISLGARLSRGDTFPTANPTDCQSLILANGRRKDAPRGRRLVGFKTHFGGPTEDAVELYFSSSGYVGISPVENQVTNVCGIAPEDVLKKFNFRFDDYLAADRALSTRLAPLSRRMEWLSACPVVMSAVAAPDTQSVYLAGDALALVDPFTGSGILNAILTGRLAGIAATRSMPVAEYVRMCRERLNRALVIARVFRTAINAQLTWLACLIPGSQLYRLTRARELP